MNELRKKIQEEVDLSANPDKLVSAYRSKVILNVGILASSLAPLLDGQGYHKDTAEKALGNIVENLIKHITLFDITEEYAEKAFKSIDTEEEPMGIDDPLKIVNVIHHILGCYLFGKDDNGKYNLFDIIHLFKGLAIYLEIDLNNTLKK